jgi:hypothetical protein
LKLEPLVEFSKLVFQLEFAELLVVSVLEELQQQVWVYPNPEVMQLFLVKLPIPAEPSVPV